MRARTRGFVRSDYAERAGRAVCDAEYREHGAGVWRDAGRRERGGGVCGVGAEGEAYCDLWPLGVRGDEGLLGPESVAKLPTVENWLKNAHTALSVAEALAEAG